MKKTASFLIIISIFLVVFLGASIIVKRALGSDSQIHYFSHLFSKCKPISQEPRTNKVILRVDDIQAFTWHGIQKQMIKDVLQQDIPLLLGVIPKNIKEDKKIYYFLKKNRCNLEIALHGWDHSRDTGGSMPEFGELNEQEAHERILKGKSILEKITKEPLTTFIPPNNAYSTGTAVALEKNNFKIISNEGDEYFDYDASTYDFENSKLIPVQEVVSECEKSFAEKNFCIIMLHPQDYATDGKLDEEKYKNYLELLTEFKNRDVEFTKAKDLIN